ncbi:monocarboxylate transporter 14-like [Argonauta hians]
MFGAKPFYGNEENKWGWLLVMAAFFNQMIAVGGGFSLGIYHLEFRRYFQGTSAEVSLVSSICLGSLMGAGPIVSYLVTKFDSGLVTILGAILSTASMIGAIFCEKLILLYITFGFLTGFGLCMSYLPSTILVGLYFKQYCSLATGMISIGIGLGELVFPFLYTYIINVFTWKGSLFILAGIFLNMCMPAFLIRPLSNCEEKPAQDPMEIVKKDISELNKELQSVIIPDTHTTNEQPKTLRLFGNIKFSVYFLNILLWNAGTIILYFQGLEFLQDEIGYNKETISSILSAVGIGNVFGSLFGGILGNVSCCDKIIIYAIFHLVNGLSAILFVYVNRYKTFIFLAIIFGLTLGGILGIMYVIAVELVSHKSSSTEKIRSDWTTVAGYVMLANGIGCFLGPPFGGWLHDITGSYTLPLYACGGITIFGGFTMLLLKLVVSGGASWSSLFINTITAD